MCTLVLPHAGKYDSLFEKPGMECSIFRSRSEDGLVCIFGERCGVAHGGWQRRREGKGENLKYSTNTEDKRNSYGITQQTMVKLHFATP